MQQTLEIPIGNASENSILAKDVVIGTGLVLIKKDTMLNARLINLLKEHDIPSVFIKLADYGGNQAAAMGIAVHRGASRAEMDGSLERFKRIHNDTEKNLRKKIVEIGKGGDIDISGLYTLTGDALRSITYMPEILVFMNYIKLRDNFTYAHSLNVSLLANLFARWLELPGEVMTTLTVAGLLHDIGKLKISLKILNKQEKLTPSEFQLLQKHVGFGIEMLSDKEDIPDDVRRAVAQHHERMNGSGYPDGLSGGEIDDGAKILAICDIFANMTAERALRARVCPFKIIRTLEQNAYGALDAKYLLVFMQNIAYLYLSSEVTLSDGRVGEIVFINDRDLSRPIVKAGDTFIDLSKNRELEVERVN